MADDKSAAEALVRDFELSRVLNQGASRLYHSVAPPRIHTPPHDMLVTAGSRSTTSTIRNTR